MDNEPLVSFIVPQYNRKEFLPKNLGSLLGQKNYSNIEILVINDGGENVSDIVEAFSDKRIRYYDKENGGLSSARNFGLQQAKGKYISTIDQDDGAFPNFLDIMVEFLENSEYKIAYCDSVRLHQKKDNFGNYQVVWRDIPYSHDFNRDLLLVMNLFPCNCILAEKECFDNVPPYDESVFVYEDYLMNLELSLKYDLIHIPVPLVWHTWREDATTMSSSRDFTTPLPNIYSKYFQYAENKVWVAQTMNSVLRSRGLPDMFKFTNNE